MQKLDESLRVQPQFDEANLRAAWISYEDDANEISENYVDALLNRKAQVSNSVRLQAEALSILPQGGREEAFNKLQLVAQSDPGRADALYALSEIAIDLRLFDQAHQILQKCKATDPTNPSCTFQIVSLRVYQNRFMEAVSEYERARRDGSYNPWLEEPVGYARMGHCDLAAAQDHFRALEQSGRTLASTVHFRASQDGMADAVLYQGRLRDARQQILHALETSNSNYDKASYYSTLG